VTRGAVSGIFSLAALVAAFAAPDALQQGHVSERVRCRAMPAVSYALYLPSRPPEGRKPPLLVLLDARRRALVPLALFLPAAERWGWVLASAWDSASDEDPEPTLRAWEAIRQDACQRFNVDEQRIYVAGFSGTARLAMFVAQESARPPSGVIASGAGFERGDPIRKDRPYAWFGAAGNSDFNHDEMLESARRLSALGFPWRLVVFEGRHQWMPAPVAADALAWMELQAIRRGLAPADPALAVQRRETGEAAAWKAEARGNPLAAYREWDALVRDLSGMTDVRPFEREAARLKESRETRLQESVEEESIVEGRRTISSWARTLRRALGAPHLLPAGKLVAEMGIARLQKTATSVREQGEAEAAKRLLSALRVRTGYTLPQELRTAGDYRGAALSLAVADAIRPHDPEVLFDLAIMRALSGEDAEAFDALRQAVAAGFCDASRLEAESAFARLHGDPEFVLLLAAALR
jgi:predicted esterase